MIMTSPPNTQLTEEKTMPDSASSASAGDIPGQVEDNNKSPGNSGSTSAMTDNNNGHDFRNNNINANSEEDDEDDDNEQSNMSTKIEFLRTTLEQVRRSTESEITRLRDELMEKNKTLEKLQIQLSEQRDYDFLKRQKQLFKSLAENSKISSNLSLIDEENNSNSAKMSPPLQSLPQAIVPPPTSSSSQEDGRAGNNSPILEPAYPGLGSSAKGLEMFLLQRAKALQHANPALKALVDLQAAGGAKPWLGDLIKPPSMVMDQANDPFNVWRNSILAPAISHSHSLTTPNSTYPPTPSPRSPSNPSITPDRGNTPITESKTPPPPPMSVASTNGLGKPLTKEEEPSIKSPLKVSEGIFSSPLMHPGNLISAGRIPKSDPMEGALQDMLRYNMEKYAGQPLDTLAAARRVRELLSVHNIGQRLFAKYVLGLSQGTVSELLSKPKTWEKLTEKGRDSYRKMHAWAYDENAIILLKSLIPRKGELSRQTRNHFIPHSMTKEEFPVDPTGMLKAGKMDPILSRFPFPSHMASGLDGLAKPRISPQSLTVPQQKFEPKKPLDELANLKKDIVKENKDSEKLSLDDSMKETFQRFAFPGLAGKSTEEMQRAVELYQAELAKLQKRALLGPSQGSDDNENNLEESLKSRIDDGEKSPNDVRSGLPPNPLSLLGLPSPAGPFPSSEHNNLSSSSPLQGMASITNSLTNQPIPNPYRPSQRNFKAVLPPITQEQFDRYDNINTEDLVRKIKEMLSQYSISQRLFGESILGLSQGSVSDLLARPKQYHMLTQKGKEPFIRMKVFLEDDQAVHKLVASQYKISPDKLMRTGNFTNNYLPTSVAGISSVFNQKQIPPPQSKLPEPPFLMRPSLSAENSLLNPSIFPNADPFDPFAMHRKLQQQQQQAAAAAAPPPPRFPSAKPISAHNSIYEMAALTQEVNTQQLTSKVREILSTHNIGQKLFGEAILGLSQGSVSELLTKPKPWNMLSIKGREPFIRMQIWLNDPQNVEKLYQLKEEKDLMKRKRHSSSSNPGSPVTVTDCFDPYGTPSSAKKSRVSFSQQQKEALRIAFSLDSHPNPNVIDFLSQELDLEASSIINWFHNHRMRFKQNNLGGSDSEDILDEPQRVPTPPPKPKSFDHTQFRLLLTQSLKNINEDHNPSSPLSRPEDLSGTGSNPPHAGSDDDSGQGSARGEESRQSREEDEILSRARSRRKPIAPQWVNPANESSSLWEDRQNHEDSLSYDYEEKRVTCDD